MTKSQQLEKNLGGKWIYDGWIGWDCEDGRRVVRTASCSCDDRCRHRPSYYLHEEGKQAVLVGFMDVFAKIEREGE